MVSLWKIPVPGSLRLVIVFSMDKARWVDTWPGGTLRPGKLVLNVDCRVLRVRELVLGTTTMK